MALSGWLLVSALSGADCLAAPAPPTTAASAATSQAKVRTHASSRSLGAAHADPLGRGSADAAESLTDNPDFPLPDQLVVPGFREMGFLPFSEQRTSSGERIKELRDPETRLIHRFQSSPAGGYLSYELLDETGNVRERRIDRPGMMFQETHTARGHVIQIFRPGAGGLIERETTTWTPGTALPEVRITYLDPALARSSCTGLPYPTSSVSSYASRISDLDWLRLTPGIEIGDTVDLGHNISADTGCDRSGERGYPGGTEGLAKETTAALKKGIACLAGSQFSGKYRPDVARLIAFMDGSLSKPMRIMCALPGEALPGYSINADGSTSNRHPTLDADSLGNAQTCDSSTEFPAVAINTRLARSEPKKERMATLFHETLHLLGYSHGSTFDLPYLAEACCMGVASSGDRRKACSLLKQYGGDASNVEDDYGQQGYEYQRNFSNLMVSQGRPSLALMSGFGSLFPARRFLPGVTPRKVRADSLVGAASALGDQPTIQMVLYQASIPNLSKDASVAIQTVLTATMDAYLPVSDATSADFLANMQKRAALSQIASLYNMTMNGNAQAAAALAPALTSAMTQACRHFSASEKADLRALASGTRLAARAVLDQRTLDATGWDDDFCP